MSNQSLNSETDREPGEGVSSRTRRRWRELSRKRKALRITLISIGTLVVLALVGAGTAFAFLSQSFGQIARVDAFDPSLKRPAATNAVDGELAPINILLLGSDSRESTTGSAATAQDFRSDVIVVAQVSPDREHVTFMSIMRDNWVEIHGHGTAKINAAIAFGGVPLAVNTVENFIGARIDHVALIDFESFTGLTDAVGGVTLDNQIPFTSLHGGFTFAKGKITLNGEEALGYVRERYAFTDGDHQRVRNQQAYLQGLMKKLLNTSTLTSPAKMNATFAALQPYLVLDSGFDLATAVGLGSELSGIRNSGFEFFTSPTSGSGTSADGQDYVLPDWEQLIEIREAFQRGDLHNYAIK